MSKVYTRFQTKTAQNPHPMGGTYLYGLYKGVQPPPPPPPTRGGATESIRQVMIRLSYIMLGLFFKRFTEAKHLALFKRFSEHFPGKYFFSSEKITLKHS